LAEHQTGPYFPSSIADTARIVAFYRALESERPNALFHDPYARQLAGARGEALVHGLASIDVASAVVAQRTAVFDELILRTVSAGEIDAVLNLAAGLDTRAYRLPLRRGLRWFDVDLPQMIAERRVLLDSAIPHCEVEMMPVDLADGSARRLLFGELNREARRILVVTEGLLLYLTPHEVAGLAADLHAPPSFTFWLTDLMSPMAARQMRRAIGNALASAGAALQFAPASGAGCLRPYGWDPIDVRLSLVEARRLGRPIPLPRLLSLVLRLIEPLQKHAGWMLDGSVLLSRQPRRQRWLRRGSVDKSCRTGMPGVSSLYAIDCNGRALALAQQRPTVVLEVAHPSQAAPNAIAAGSAASTAG
jgi:methyltransferase (TIGR00027 family)